MVRVHIAFVKPQEKNSQNKYEREETPLLYVDE